MIEYPISRQDVQELIEDVRAQLPENVVMLSHIRDLMTGWAFEIMLYPAHEQSPEVRVRIGEGDTIGQLDQMRRLLKVAAAIYMQPDRASGDPDR